MQDKEFDDIFRAQLEGFEAEPSAAVWQNIANGLDGKRKRKKAPVWWLGVAASMLIISSIGWWLVARQQPVKQNTVVRAKPTRHENNVQPVNRSLLAANQSVAKPGVGSKIVSPTRIEKTATPKNKADESMPTNQPKTDETILPANHSEVLAATRVNDIQTDIQPEKPLFKTNLQPAANTVQTVAVAPPKRRGHTLGDLINKVVASVDKRADKLIEFTDNDEDESTITGINLGLVKIKKENK